MLSVRFIFSAIALAVSVSAQAQVYPAKAVRLIVPYPAGGGIDPLLSSPEDASAYIRNETLKWSKVISDGRISVE